MLRTLILILVLTTITGPTLLAKNIFVEKVLNMTKSSNMTITLEELLKSSITDNGHQIITIKEKSDFSLKLKVMKLGKSYIITLSQAKDDKILQTRKLKTKDIEEFDKIITNLTSLIFEQKQSAPVVVQKAQIKPKETKVGQIDKSKTDQLTTRVKALNLKVVGFGPAWLDNMNTSGMGYKFKYGQMFEVKDQMAIQIDGSITAHNDVELSLVSSIGLGLNYYFLLTDFSPFVGAGLGYGLANNKFMDHVKSFTYNLKGGVIFFRTSDVQLLADLSFLSFFDESRLGTPSELSLGISLLY